ncbi:LMBR1 domain-containing protein 1 [Strigomonas culicis]|uniref:LMBR1 domain-containing protein 1 n=1 Tax=Strigomonas culicis TaxID=28005 RepID=S9U7P2_9TRYP|nr:LMBR1 domain-containing protein 1 [Strigomonas culicis]|eukprot:EPY24918.1 LMBR1 domain-containing protein 1 [Strigomonas culicis]
MNIMPCPYMSFSTFTCTSTNYASHVLLLLSSHRTCKRSFNLLLIALAAPTATLSLPSLQMLWWLVLISVIVALVILLLALYVVCYFAADEDRGEAWSIRVVAVLIISFACYNILLLPLDVGNASEATGLNMLWVWSAVLLTSVLLFTVAAPFAMMYYEAWDPAEDGHGHQVKAALLPAAIVSAIFWIALAGVHFFCSTPITDDLNNATGLHNETENEVLSSALFTSLVGFSSMLGWPFFAVFGGIGLVFLPCAGVQHFLGRPKPVSPIDYEAAHASLHTTSARLMEEGRALDAESAGGLRLSRSTWRKVVRFKREVREVEHEYERLEEAYNQDNGTILHYYAGLLLAFVGTPLSFLWIAHIIVFDLTGLHPFLNRLLVTMDGALPMLGPLTYSVFAFYMLLCTLLGCYKVCCRFTLFPVFYMRVGGTMLNAILFNSTVLLLAAFSVLQLCVNSFRVYTARTVLYSIFVESIQHKAFLRAVFPIGCYSLLVIAFLFTLYQLLHYGKKEDELEEDDDF